MLFAAWCSTEMKVTESAEALARKEGEAKVAEAMKVAAEAAAAAKHEGEAKAAKAVAVTQAEAANRVRLLEATLLV